ncbi:MAG: sugar ABC transporter ATP-binding protein [Chloroflexota bacterium]|nr:sugar ABC transporter ATP-binding protein [Chloroflexota bacterium]
MVSTTAVATTNGAAARPVLLSLQGVTKRFGGATALDGVDFELAAGETHGLIGENGAGKSTLMKILSGVHQPDTGQISIRDELCQFASPGDAKARGIGMIYQELSLMPALSVAENVFLGRQPVNRLGLVDWPRMNREAAAQLQSLGIDLDVTERLGNLSLGAQQLVEIARTAFSGADVIVLDEPTSALSVPETERLFALMAALKEQGKSLIFISHFLEDVLAVSDRVTVLKNARKVATLPCQDLTKHRMIELMIGRDASALADSYEGFTTLPAESAAPVVLDIRRLTSPGSFTDISLSVRQGEIVGMFGFLGAGMTELARALFGQVRPHSGELRLNGAVIQPRSAEQAKKLGIAYLTENRRTTIFPRHEIYKNITLAHLDHLVKPFFRSSAELPVATAQVQRTGVRPANAEMLAGHLSGGNQQKVVLAKWLTEQPTLLILNEPTRGMDVGAKREVLDLIKLLKDEGVAIMLLSTEPETVIAESDRVLVMAKGRITKEFVAERVSKDVLMTYA